RPIGSNLRLKNPVTFVRHALGPVTACQLLAPTRPAGVDWFPKWKGMRKQGLNPGGCLTCDPHCIICTTEIETAWPVSRPYLSCLRPPPRLIS
ncbi:hypothetical protein HW555_010334, partial [Spodoptera exigua]